MHDVEVQLQLTVFSITGDSGLHICIHFDETKLEILRISLSEPVRRINHLSFSPINKLLSDDICHVVPLTYQPAGDLHVKKERADINIHRLETTCMSDWRASLPDSLLTLSLSSSAAVLAVTLYSGDLVPGPIQKESTNGSIAYEYLVSAYNLQFREFLSRALF